MTKKDCPLRPVRLGAVNEFPYYSDILAILTFHETDKVETMAIDQYCRVYYNLKWLQSLTPIQRIAILTHEGLHRIMNHAERGQRLNALPELWNIAGDMEINDGPRLRQMLEGTNGVFPETYNLPDGKLAEFYYHQLLQDEKGQYRLPPKKGEEDDEEKEDGDQPVESDSDGDKEPSDSKDGKGKGKGKKDSRPGKVAAGNCGSGADGQKREYELPSPQDGGPDGVSEEDLEVVRQQIAIKVTQSEKARGEIPAGCLRVFEEMLKPPKVNWRTILMQSARDCFAYVYGQEEYTYALPPRRVGIPGSRIVNPAVISPTPNVGLLFDTSGSVSYDELNRAASETEGIFRSLDSSARIRYLSCDSKCYGISDVNNIQSLELRGGGGTDMRVGINKALEEKEKMDVLVVFTDGYTPWPDVAPKGMKIVCCLIGNRVSDDTPSWMKTIQIEED